MKTINIYSKHCESSGNTFSNSAIILQPQYLTSFFLTLVECNANLNRNNENSISCCPNFAGVLVLTANVTINFTNRLTQGSLVFTTRARLNSLPNSIVNCSVLHF